MPADGIVAKRGQAAKSLGQGKQKISVYSGSFNDTMEKEFKCRRMESLPAEIRLRCRGHTTYK